MRLTPAGPSVVAATSWSSLISPPAFRPLKLPDVSCLQRPKAQVVAAAMELESVSAAAIGFECRVVSIAAGYSLLVGVQSSAYRFYLPPTPLPIERFLDAIQKLHTRIYELVHDTCIYGLVHGFNLWIQSKNGTGLDWVG